MSSSPDHATVSQPAYGAGGRTSRPLWALIPIGILMAIVLAMLAEGLHVMTTPSDSAAGEAHIVATTGASAGPAAQSRG